MPAPDDAADDDLLNILVFKVEVLLFERRIVGLGHKLTLFLNPDNSCPAEASRTT